MDTRLKRNVFVTLVSALIVVAALALPGRAGATLYNYGPQSSDLFYGVSHTGSFQDQIQFNVATPFTVTLLDQFTNFGLMFGLNATLYSLSSGAPQYMGGSNTPAFGSSFVNLASSAPLPAGSYELRISGFGLPGGYYSGRMTLAPTTTVPIPEPETYAMILAGLGLMGFVARRRKRKEV